MGCILALLALFFPRIIIILVWLFSDYLEDAYQTMLWPVLGFFFMPLTTLAYAFAWHYGGGSIQGLGLVVLIVAVLMDLSSWGGGWRSSRKRTVVVKRE